MAVYLSKMAATMVGPMYDHSIRNICSWDGD